MNLEQLLIRAVECVSQKAGAAPNDYWLYIANYDFWTFYEVHGNGD